MVTNYDFYCTGPQVDTVKSAEELCKRSPKDWFIAGSVRIGQFNFISLDEILALDSSTSYLFITTSTT